MIFYFAQIFKYVLGCLMKNHQSQENRIMKRHTAFLVLIIGVLLLSACSQSAPKDGGYGDLRDFLPTSEELMTAGLNMRLSNKKHTSETTNEDLMKSEYYDEADEALIYELGRETQWSRGFIDNNTDKFSVICEITSYSNKENAKLAVERFNEAEKEAERVAERGLPCMIACYVDKEFDIGDITVSYQGIESVKFIEYSYGNLVVKIWSFDAQDFDTAEAVARVVFDKIDASKP